MFSKSKINEPAQKAPEANKPIESEKTASTVPVAKPKPPASMLSKDLNIVGNIKTTGDIQVEGTGSVQRQDDPLATGAKPKAEFIKKQETEVKT
ncbi:MAG: hypothetical protein EBW90_04530 [Rhodobacteraceae bacterium]|nr:hypothetical protein [Paracoccaceae bacterium]